MKKLNRRDFSKTIGGASGFLLLNSNCAFNFPNSSFRTPLNVPSDRGLFGVLEPSVPFTMTARGIEHQIVPSQNTRLWVYEAEVGSKQYINPIIRMKKGNTFSPTLENELSEPTIIHWHGLHVDHENDGHPISQIEPLDEYQYDWHFQTVSGSA